MMALVCFAPALASAKKRARSLPSKPRLYTLAKLSIPKTFTTQIKPGKTVPRPPFS